MLCLVLHKQNIVLLIVIVPRLLCVLIKLGLIELSICVIEMPNVWNRVLNFRGVAEGETGDPWVGSGLVSSLSQHLAPIFYNLIHAGTNTG